MEVIPAIDLRGGRCVRLYQGDYSKETVYSDDPLEVALKWQEMGATRIHVVDLDGAASGKPENMAVLKRLADSVDVALQVGGGIRDMSTCEEMLDMGVQRIVLGTVAVQEPSLVEQLCRRLGSEAVVVGVDAKDGMVAIRGWLESTSSTALELIHRMEGLGVKRFLYTDISRDGTLTEPNFQAVDEVVRGSNAAIIAAGGVSSIEQLEHLSSVGVEGAIVGMALYTGAIDLKEAIASV